MNSLVADGSIVTILTAISLLAVCVPLFRGMRLCLRARRATRAVPAPQLKKAAEQPAKVAVEPLSVVMLRVLMKSLRDGDRDAYPADFVLDASKQYVVNEYESHYSHIISMYANLLPPIGFIGTTSGMLILFASMHLADSSLELGALALALTSSIFALMGFALLEGMKIRLYGRLLKAVDTVVGVYRSAESASRSPA